MSYTFKNPNQVFTLADTKSCLVSGSVSVIGSKSMLMISLGRGMISGVFLRLGKVNGDRDVLELGQVKGDRGDKGSSFDKNKFDSADELVLRI